MKIFQIFGLQPIAPIWAKLKHFYSILLPNVVIFVQIRGMDRVFKLNNRPKTDEQDPVSSISDSYHGPGFCCQAFTVYIEVNLIVFDLPNGIVSLLYSLKIILRNRD